MVGNGTVRCGGAHLRRLTLLADSRVRICVMAMSLRVARRSGCGRSWRMMTEFRLSRLVRTTSCSSGAGMGGFILHTRRWRQVGRARRPSPTGFPCHCLAVWPNEDFRIDETSHYDASSRGSTAEGRTPSGAMKEGSSMEPKVAIHSAERVSRSN